ncbi:TPA: DNA repair protein RadA [Corynebacterium striatum]|nr:DNA repair protein RadA [Corynebacterium striatum]HAT1252229.1 DNA repair protein RadA [Corynebacterium striatum]HAT1265236.1 DNA repair protein RadA [Corynebacterium striatum]HAT1316917.1 DNA repair protein RadA [Corynebacterium striatum]HAT1437020.1 DNA repair protein RadA [Corynebacterium striatum]
MAKKSRPIHTCSECGYVSPKWLGRCPDCGSWGTLQESAPAASEGTAASAAVTGQMIKGLTPSSPAQPITKIGASATKTINTGIGELDRVLGKGIVPGSVVLMAGEPGVGKSTLLLEVASRWAQLERTALYVTAEESAGQVRARAERTDALHETLYLAAESNLDVVFGHVEQLKPSLIIVDSVQTMHAAGVEGVAGGVAQSRAVTAALTTLAKSTGIPVLLVGHVTKDGNVAGPRVLEHLVDVVLNFEGDRQSSLRMLRGIKNRFGATDEVGCFEQTSGGIREVADPSGLFLSHRGSTPDGSAVTVAMDGVRPMLAEVQALTVDPVAKNPRRVVTGLDSNRVPMVLAVLQARAGERTNDKDAYVATVGGVRIQETATDLAVALATWSSLHEKPLPPKTVVIGEVGLAGELRRVPNLDRRLSEAARLGYENAIVPAGKVDAAGIRVLQAGTLGEAIALLR